VIDVSEYLAAFQAINRTKVVIRLEAADHQGMADLRLTAVAYRLPEDSAELAPLASAESTWMATNLKSLDSALIHVLYLLDFQLGKSEFERVIPKSV
jgi:hypothetical protein